MNSMFLTTLEMAFGSLMENKFRTMLAMLGMIVGIFGLIIILCMGETVRNFVIGQFTRIIGSNTIFLMGAARYENGVKASSVQPLYESELFSIMESVQEIDMMSPLVGRKTVVKRMDRNARAKVSGVDTTHFLIGKDRIFQGRTFTHLEVVNRARVSVIGSKVAKELFPFGSPLSHKIRINGEEFEVIGLTGKDKAMDQDLDGGRIFVPYTTAMETITHQKEIYLCQISLKEGSDPTRVRKKIRAQMRLKRGLFGDQSDNFRVQSLQEEMAEFNKITHILTAGLGAIAAISLLVGGIGIMNIMLVTVSERTREIGVRKALGARDRDILTQFLVESVFMSLLGSFLGTALALICIFALATYLGVEVFGIFLSILVATIFGSFIGVTFGYFPALRAARLDPIECLRYE